MAAFLFTFGVVMLVLALTLMMGTSAREAAWDQRDRA